MQDGPEVFQSTLPVRGATPQCPRSALCMDISIHAPRKGSDMRDWSPCASACSISIHAPRKGSDFLGEGG